MTEKEFFNAVLEQFAHNPERRNIINGTCKYLPVNDEPFNKGCTIGMFLQPENSAFLDKKGVSVHTATRKYPNLLPEWMRVMDADFLQDVQRLHDWRTYWCDTGLSEYGKRRVNDIRITYNL